MIIIPMNRKILHLCFFLFRAVVRGGWGLEIEYSHLFSGIF